MNNADELLAQLRDVQAPPVSAIPAIGWWVVVLICVLALVSLVWFFTQRYQKRGWHREAKEQLIAIRAVAGKQPVNQTLSAASKLTRQVVLAVRPRTDVASLHGQAWLAELDSVCGKPLFADGYGNLLELGPYQRTPQIAQHDLDELLDVVDVLIDSAASQYRKSGTS